MTYLALAATHQGLFAPHFESFGSWNRSSSRYDDKSLEGTFSQHFAITASLGLHDAEIFFLDSDDALQGLDLSVSPHPILQKLRLTVTQCRNPKAPAMAFTSLKTVLRNSPSHLILDLSQLPGQTLDHVGEGLSLDSTLRTLELVLPDEGWSNAQFKELCESLVRRSRMRSLTIASSYDEGDEEFSVWSCPVPPLLDLLLGCVALEELQLKGMHATSNFMTIYVYRSEPLRGSTLKQLKLGQCYIDDGKLATLGRLLTKISTNL